MTSDAEGINIEEVLARIAPPSTPAEALANSPRLGQLASSLNPVRSAAVLAGLMTDQRFQAYTVRLDYALRLILSLGNGQEKLRQRHLNELLNRYSVEARIERLEDPIEDFFTEAVPTERGDYLIFSGIWEKAAVHTECVLRAFERLPDWSGKQRALVSAYTLLALGDALVRRAGLERRLIGSGTPGGPIPVPSDQRLQILAQRVRFAPAELNALGIDKHALEPFFLAERTAVGLSTSHPGDSSLEFQPLVATESGLLIAAPANISTAARAWLIDNVLSAGQTETFRQNLLREQLQLVRHGGFVRLTEIEREPQPDGSFRQGIYEISAGRYVHVLQTIDDFAAWPRHAFGEPRPYPEDRARAILEAIRSAKRFAERQAGFVEGMTVWLIGGWGSGYSVRLENDPELRGWLLVEVEPADAALLGASDDGSVGDVWRLHKELSLVGQQGFEFYAVNGLLNLFQWWKKTDYALVPPHMVEMTPPLTINFDTNFLLQVRQAAQDAYDRRTVRHPDGCYHLVARLNHKSFAGRLDPIYASIDAANDRHLLGVVLSQRSAWWVDFLNAGQSPQFKFAFKLWEAVLSWVAVVMPSFLAELAPKEILPDIVIGLELQWEGAERERYPADEEIADTIAVAVEHANNRVRLVIRPEWKWVLRRTENTAELLLATRILEGAALLFGVERTAPELAAMARQAAGSVDYRWLHLFFAHTALDGLTANGLVTEFHPIPVSAGALAKCGAVWMTRPRNLGHSIVGKDACIEFLTNHSRNLLELFKQEVRRYDRKALVVTALEDIQAALDEQRQWRMTARALRAAHGVQADYEASLRRAKQVNGVLRAASMLAEIANAECVNGGGLRVGRMDVDELQARALMVFAAGDLLAALHGDRIEPRFNISPTGDLQYDHSFEEESIQRAAEIAHQTDRKTASADYGEQFEVEPLAVGIEARLHEAVGAEYGMKFETFVKFPNAAVELAAGRGAGVIVLRRSDLIAALEGAEILANAPIAPLIDRLTMPARRSWGDPLPGTRPADFDFAKFDRRFSLIARPIVALSAEPDPELVIAPAVIQRAMLHNLSGALTGSLQNEFWQSDAMRKFSSNAGAAAGIKFNMRVAERLQELQLQAWPSVAPAWCLNQKATPDLKALGDIDVLAVSPDGSCVWVVEAKDLKLCRTLGEAARRLSEYRGKLTAKGKPDKLLRHLSRVSYIRANASALGQRLRLRALPRVHGLVVVHAPQPMEQIASDVGPDGKFVMLSDIANVPWSKGWS